MAGSIGCAGLGVSGQGGDSVIRINQNIIESVTFPEAEGLIQSISESVTVNVT
jgi:hypothetical protein